MHMYTSLLHYVAMARKFRQRVYKVHESLFLLNDVATLDVLTRIVAGIEKIEHPSVRQNLAIVSRKVQSLARVDRRRSAMQLQR